MWKIDGHVYLLKCVCKSIDEQLKKIFQSIHDLQLEHINVYFDIFY